MAQDEAGKVGIKEGVEKVGAALLLLQEARSGALGEGIGDFYSFHRAVDELEAAFQGLGEYCAKAGIEL